jgi:hypothetical protein
MVAEPSVQLGRARPIQSLSPEGLGGPAQTALAAWAGVVRLSSGKGRLEMTAPTEHPNDPNDDAAPITHSSSQDTGRYTFSIRRA